MNEMMTEARPPLGTFFRDTVGATENRPQIALATERFRAIDLSCRACEASAGAGAKTSNSELDFPVGEPSVLLPQPPILLAEKPLCKSGRFCISGNTFWLQSTGSRFGSISNWGFGYRTSLR